MNTNFIRRIEVIVGFLLLIVLVLPMDGLPLVAIVMEELLFGTLFLIMMIFLVYRLITGKPRNIFISTKKSCYKVLGIRLKKSNRAYTSYRTYKMRA
jgi:hypothetical protein